MDTATVTNTRRISKAGRFARAHKGFIYEVTDPELRAQLASYRHQQVQE